MLIPFGRIMVVPRAVMKVLAVGGTACAVGRPVLQTGGIVTFVPSGSTRILPPLKHWIVSPPLFPARLARLARLASRARNLRPFLA